MFPRRTARGEGLEGQGDSPDGHLDDALPLAVDTVCNGEGSDGLAPPAGRISSETDLWQCAICLDDIDFADIAVIKGCEHTYCVHCILKWASVRADSHCPTCKKPFTNLLVHRQIDGALTDFQIEESATLLACSDWFQRWLKEHEQTRDLYKFSTFRSVAAASTELSPEALRQQEWAEDALCEFFDDECEDDEEIEEYYLSRAGTSRVTFGNRRWGANGYVKTGHRRAQPTQAPNTPKGGKKAGRGCGTPASAPARMCGGGGEMEASTKAGASGGGRRARRKARRAELDGTA